MESAVLFAAVLLLVRTSKKESIKLDCVGIAHNDMSLHLGIGDELTTVVFFSIDSPGSARRALQRIGL